MLKWFYISWYKWLFEKFDDPGYCHWYRHILCRIKGHPSGSWFYNVGGLEPDDTCKDCGDHIGA